MFLKPGEFCYYFDRFFCYLWCKLTLLTFMQAHWLSAIWYLNFAATLVLILRLARNGLYCVYPFLFVYLATDAAQTAALLLLRPRSNAYGWTYVFGQLVKIVLAIFVILEQYRVALAQRPALARFGRDAVGYILGAAAVLALSLLMLDSSIPPGQSKILHRVFSFERTMNVWMLTFLLVIGVFMTWFPVRMTRNGALYVAGFAIYFLSRALGLLLINLAPDFQKSFDLAMLTVSFACLMVWLFALRREGEETTVVTGARRDPARIQQLTQQLDGMNARLAEIGRR
jgi:hypothetical protein